MLLIAAALLAACSLSAQTHLYQRYADREDVRVASVTNFALDSGIVADVTLLEAVDDEGWQWLSSEFRLIPLSDEQQRQMLQGWDVVMFAQRDRQDPRREAAVVNEQIDAASICYLGVSYLSRTVYVFDCTTDRQSDVIVEYLIQKLRHNFDRR